jgi:hypothetical protein
MSHQLKYLTKKISANGIRHTAQNQPATASQALRVANKFMRDRHSRAISLTVGL